MACPLPHTVDEIHALVQKIIHEDSVRQKAMMDLAVQFDNASAAKHDLRKAYEKCNDISQETQYQQLLQDEEVLRETLEEQARAKKVLEDRIKKEQAEHELFMLEFGVQSDSEYELD
ncbi:hypothetical protein Tco_0233237 [Tanacetum coccineum]